LIPPGAQRQVWTKLQLDKAKQRPRELALLLALLSDDPDVLRLARSQGDDEDDESPPLYPGKEPVDVVADFLKAVKDTAFESIQKSLPSKALFDSLPLDVVITVPAVWSDKVKNLTLQAVDRAGFGSKASLRWSQSLKQLRYMLSNRGKRSLERHISSLGTTLCSATLVWHC
jgi:hypothetical protein